MKIIACANYRYKDIAMHWLLRMREINLLKDVIFVSHDKEMDLLAKELGANSLLREFSNFDKSTNFSSYWQFRCDLFIDLLNAPGK